MPADLGCRCRLRGWGSFGLRAGSLRLDRLRARGNSRRVQCVNEWNQSDHNEGLITNKYIEVQVLRFRLTVDGSCAMPRSDLWT